MLYNFTILYMAIMEVTITLTYILNNSMKNNMKYNPRGQELLLVTTNYSYIIILGSSCTFVDFKTKYLWNIALHWPGWLYVCICHQK